MNDDARLLLGGSMFHFISVFWRCGVVGGNRFIWTNIVVASE